MHNTVCEAKTRMEQAAKAKVTTQRRTRTGSRDTIKLTTCGECPFKFQKTCFTLESEAFCFAP